MTMNLKKIFGMPVVAGLFVTTLLAGCSGDNKSVTASEAANEMYQHISMDAVVLMRVDLKAVAENAGADFSGGKFKPGKVLQEVIDQVADEAPEVNDELLDKIFAAVDMENVVLSVDNGSEVFFTAPLTDREFVVTEFQDEKLKKFDISEIDASAYSNQGREKAEEVGKYDIYYSEADDTPVYFMIRDNQMWVASSPNTVMNDYTQAVETGSVASNRKCLDVLTAGTVNAIINYEALTRMGLAQMPEGMKIAYAGVNLVLDGGKMKGEMRVYDKEFVKQSYDSKELGQPISAADFSMIPADANLVMALGCPNKAGIQTILSLVKLEPFVKSIAEEVLNGLEGSIVLGATVPTSMTDIANLPAWNVTLAVGFEKETAENLLSMLPLIGGKKQGTGYSIDVPVEHMGNVTLYVAYEKGQIVVSTAPLDSRRGFASAKTLVGSAFGMYVNLLSDGLAMQLSGMDCGVQADMIINEEGAEGQLHLTDTKNALLTTILERIIR